TVRSGDEVSAPQARPRPRRPKPRRPTMTLAPVATSTPDAKTAARGSPGIIVGGRYILLRAIGAGSMGSVWEAEDQLIGRRVALKLLDRVRVQPQDAGRRFRREAHAAASIEHPHVVVVHDFQRRQDGTYYI